MPVSVSTSGTTRLEAADGGAVQHIAATIKVGVPLGGLDAGHKGFALAILIEALTAGLAGHGRADPPAGWGGTVFVQALDPEAFGGATAFAQQIDWLVDACHGATPRAGVERVRLPGENGMARFREQRANGVRLHSTIMPALRPWCEKLGVAVPLEAGPSRSLS